MKKFKYKIEAYLKYIKHLRDKALQIFKEAEEAVKRIEESMKETDKKIKEAYEISSGVGKSTQNIHFINDNNIYLNSLKHKMTDLSQDLKAAEDVYRDKYEKLLALQQKLKSIEMHKEKSLKDYKKEYKKHEQKLNDEINSVRRGGGKNAKPLR